jgi:hypothetical protein
LKDVHQSALSFPAASSSGYAWRGPWLRYQKYCSSTSQPRPWTRSPRRGSRTLIFALKEHSDHLIVTHNMGTGRPRGRFHRVHVPGRAGRARRHLADFFSDATETRSETEKYLTARSGRMRKCPRPAAQIRRPVPSPIRRGFGPIFLARRRSWRWLSPEASRAAQAQIEREFQGRQRAAQNPERTNAECRSLNSSGPWFPCVRSS